MRCHFLVSRRLRTSSVRVGLPFVSNQSFTIDLSAPVVLRDVPALAQRVFVWWIGELKSLAPKWSYDLFPKPPHAAMLLARGNVWRIVPDGDDERALELDSTAGGTELADQILHGEPNFSLQRLTVVLEQGAILRRRIELPIMPERDVRSAVELQVDRLSPFKTDAVRFAVRIVDRDGVEGKLTADVAIAPRSSIEAIEHRLGALGLAAVAIDVDGGNGAPAGFDLRARSDDATPRREMMINVAIACVVVFTWYLAGVAWETAREREIDGWQNRITSLRPLAQRSAVLRQQLDAMAQPFAMARSHKPGFTLEVLSELTNVLPDAVRLTELRLSGDVIDLTGVAQDAPGLIAKLEVSRFFKEVRFSSPVVRRPEVNKDRFEMSLRLEGGAPR